MTDDPMIIRCKCGEEWPERENILTGDMVHIRPKIKRRRTKDSPPPCQHPHDQAEWWDAKQKVWHPVIVRRPDAQDADR